MSIIQIKNRYMSQMYLTHQLGKQGGKQTQRAFEGP